MFSLPHFLDDLGEESPTLYGAVLVSRLTFLDAHRLSRGESAYPFEALAASLDACHANIAERYPQTVATFPTFAAELASEVSRMPMFIRTAFLEGEISLIQARFAKLHGHTAAELREHITKNARYRAKFLANFTGIVVTVPAEPDAGALDLFNTSQTPPEHLASYLAGLRGRVTRIPLTDA